MSLTKLLKINLLLVLLLTTKLAVASYQSTISKPNPEENWNTISTEHFDINYQVEHLGFAKRLAAIAERVYSEYTVRLNWKPQAKTQIIVDGTTDLPNGWTIPAPYNKSAIYLTPSTTGELMDHTGWIEQVFTHEFVHVLHLDQVAGNVKNMRKIFGRLIFPQTLAPSWLSEGLAVHYESIDGLGRSNNAIFESKMRNEVMNGVLSYPEITYNLDSRWPFGQHYVYGTYFFKFIEKTYGRKKLISYIQNYSDNFVPYRMDNRARLAFGKGIDELWSEYQTYLKKRFAPQIAAIKSKPTQTSKILVDASYINTFLSKTDDGSLIYYHNDVVEKPSVRRLNKDGTDTVLFESKGVRFLSWNNQGLLMGKTAICDNYRLVTDLYLYDFKEKNTKKLLSCASVKNVVWQQDGRAIYATLLDHNNGTMKLVKIDNLKQPKITTLYNFKLGEAIGKIDLSDDSKKMVASVKRVKTGWNLETFNLTTNTWQKLTLSSRLERSPKYYKNFVYYISDTKDRTQLELYRLNLSTNKTEQLTNSLGYVSDFAFGNNNELWLSVYGKKGQKIHWVRSIKSIERPRPNSKKPANLTNLVTNNLDVSKVPAGKEYSALNTLAPVSWFPVIGGSKNDFDSFGINILGSDILQFHSWTAKPVLYFDKKLKVLAGSASYDFHNLLAFNINKIIKSVGPSKTLYRKKTTLQAKLHYPINFDNATLDIGIATTRKTDRTLSTDKSYQAKKESTDYLTGLMVDFTNLDIYKHSISPVGGWLISAVSEKYDSNKNSNYSGNANILEVQYFIGIAGKHSLDIAVLSAQSDKTAKPFQLGGNSIKPAADFLGQRDFDLKGYDKDLAVLKGRFAEKASLTYHFPIMNIYNGYSILPLGFGKITGSIAWHIGAAWDEVANKKSYTSKSIELSTDIVMAGFPLFATVGYASGDDKNLGKEQSYFGINVKF